MNGNYYSTEKLGRKPCVSSSCVTTNTAEGMVLTRASDIEAVEYTNASSLSQRDAYELMLREYPDVMNVDQVSELFGVSTKTVYKLLQEGKIACLKVGRSYRIPKAHLFTYLMIGSNSNSKL